MKILALHLQSYLEYAHIRGIPKEALTETMELVPPDLNDPKAVVSVQDFYGVLEKLHSFLQDDHLGWRIGNFMNLNSLGLIYKISLQTKTVEEALFYLNDFLIKTFPLVALRTSQNTGSYVLQLTIPSGKILLNRMIMECLLCIMARELTIMSQNKISLKISSPYYQTDYPPNFVYGKEYSVEFTNLNLKASIRRIDQAQLGYLLPAYLYLIEGLKVNNDFQSKVKMVTLHLAKPELPDLEEIAATFHLTPRTFQRKLATEQTTFRKVTDALKKQLADLLLRHKAYSITDIALLLGYAEPASFVHSFKRWYNCAPSHKRTNINGT